MSNALGMQLSSWLFSINIKLKIAIQLNALFEVLVTGVLRLSIKEKPWLNGQ